MLEVARLLKCNGLLEPEVVDTFSEISTVVLDEFVGLLILDYDENLEVAEFGHFNCFADESSLPLALDVHSQGLVFDGVGFLGLFLLSLHFVLAVSCSLKFNLILYIYADLAA